MSKSLADLYQETADNPSYKYKMELFTKAPKQLCKDWNIIKKYELMSDYYGVRHSKVIQCMLSLFGEDETYEVFKDARSYLSGYFGFGDSNGFNEYQKFLITYYHNGKIGDPFCKTRDELYTLIWNKLFKCSIDYDTNDLMVYPASLYYNLLHHTIAYGYEKRK